jgi:lantibiotic leader peptide-processing serine protease
VSIAADPTRDHGIGDHNAGETRCVLIASTGASSTGSIIAKLQTTADHVACPLDLSIYAFFPAVDDGAPQTCTGDLLYNSWNGPGQVNALRAVGG